MHKIVQKNPKNLNLELLKLKAWVFGSNFFKIFIPAFCLVLMGQTKTFHIFPDTIPSGLFWTCHLSSSL